MITVAGPAERPRVLASLVAAFAADPVLRHLFPDDATYPRYAAAFFGWLFDKRVHRGTVWTVDGGAAVAMWDPPVPGPTPGTDPPVPDPGPGADPLAGRLPADALARVRAYDEAIHAALPQVPFWYLGVLGTDPACAGRRLGRAAALPGLRRAAADGVPAVLETSNPGNVPRYRGAGWRVTREFALGQLTVWIMQQP